MAVLLPPSPLVEGTREVFDVPLVIPADVFTQLWQGSNLRKFYFNIDDSHMEEAYELLKEYRQTKAVGMNIVSRKEIEAQYEAETRSSALNPDLLSYRIRGKNFIAFCRRTDGKDVISACEFFRIIFSFHDIPPA